MIITFINNRLRFFTDFSIRIDLVLLLKEKTKYWFWLIYKFILQMPINHHILYIMKISKYHTCFSNFLLIPSSCSKAHTYINARPSIFHSLSFLLYIRIVNNWTRFCIALKRCPEEDKWWMTAIEIIPSNVFGLNQ